MGDRYELSIRCAYCKEINDAWYAPTCSSYTFKCEKCKKRNFITPTFKAKKIEETTLEEVRGGFLMSTNASWTEEEVDRMSKETFKQITGG